MRVSSCHKAKIIKHWITKQKICSQCCYYCNFIEYKQIKIKKWKLPLSLIK